MAIKVTLTMEASVISDAKKYARNRGISLSNLVKNYLHLLTAEDAKKEKQVLQGQKLLGVLKLKPDFDYKTELAKCIVKKTR
jgi:hypothetical protein